MNLPAIEGATDFDFIFGRWNIHNRKIRDNRDPKCAEWLEFDATSEAFPILAGRGNVDRMHVPETPEIDAFEGFTLRLFDPRTQTWSIWWSSTTNPGVLDSPVVGRFDNGHGTFECLQEIAGDLVMVRFEWLVGTAHTPRWQQSFSYDEGQTWRLNWVKDHTRAR